ncbi:MAG TPA: glycosyltransferase family 2 protein [Pyrinomonadaceae bacterium]|jgi:cellulose synthase/poly-beta-1,6-N-acetylglucosamine synthase-like glycosyltransferase
MWVFYLFAALIIWQSIIALIGGVRYLSYVRREIDAPRPLYMPLASVVVPCRGLDQGLRANFHALFRQHYPRYELIFVSDRADDPAIAVAREVWRNETEQGNDVATAVRFVVAGRARDCGQKVHNLLVAVREIDAASEVIVFVDTDARPRADWLRSLVAPLADEGVGAATGYRWFVPVVGNFASQLRAVWNASIASALGANRHRNFCWGGSTAIRRETFERVRIVEEWRGALSDDFAMTRALARAKLPIHFVPDCLTASHEDCNFRELVEFTTRQLKITRVYAPHLWTIVLVSNLAWSLVFYGGLALTATRAALGFSVEWPLALLCFIYMLGMWKAFFRLRAVSLVLEDAHAQLRAGAPAHLFLWPLASVLYVYNAFAALLSRRIDWRGITYELKSPHETVIISGVSTEESPEDATVATTTAAATATEIKRETTHAS